MHRQVLRGFVVISALAAVMILADGCGSSGHPSAAKTSPAVTSSMSATAAACQKIQTTLAQAPATLGKLVLHPSSARPEVTAFITKLKNEAAAAGNASLTAAVDQFTSSVQNALGSLQSNPGSVTSLISQLTKDSQKIVTACTKAVG